MIKPRLYWLDNGSEYERTVPSVSLRVREVGNFERELIYQPFEDVDRLEPLILRSNEMRAYLQTDCLLDLKIEVETDERPWRSLTRDEDDEVGQDPPPAVVVAEEEAEPPDEDGASQSTIPT